MTTVLPIIYQSAEKVRNTQDKQIPVKPTYLI
jgi:hypothetical protein